MIIIAYYLRQAKNSQGSENAKTIFRFRQVLFGRSPVRNKITFAILTLQLKWRSLPATVQLHPPPRHLLAQ